MIRSDPNVRVLTMELSRFYHCSLSVGILRRAENWSQNPTPAILSDIEIYRQPSTGLHPINASAMHRCMELTEDSIKQIERIHCNWIQMEAAGEIGHLLDSCGDEIEFWPPGSPHVVGRDAIMAWIRRGKEKIQSIEISDRRIRGSNEIAYLTASYKSFGLSEKSKGQTSPRKPLMDIAEPYWQLANQSGDLVTVGLKCSFSPAQIFLSTIEMSRQLTSRITGRSTSSAEARIAASS